MRSCVPQQIQVLEKFWQFAWYKELILGTNLLMVSVAWLTFALTAASKFMKIAIYSFWVPQYRAYGQEHTQSNSIHGCWFMSLWCMHLFNATPESSSLSYHSTALLPNFPKVTISPSTVAELFAPESRAELQGAVAACTRGPNQEQYSSNANGQKQTGITCDYYMSK